MISQKDSSYPFVCLGCEATQMVFMENSKRPTKVRGVEEYGFECVECGKWEHICYWNLSLHMKDKEINKLIPYSKLYKRKYNKLLTGYHGLQKRMKSYGTSRNSHLAPS